MKYFLIAGESSGDLHTSNLMREIIKLDRNADMQYFGGNRMLSVGGKLLKHYSEMDFMGFAEVLSNLGKISRNFKDCKKAILNFKPDVVILTDYPGFNLRIAKFCKQNGFKTIYYISPKVWAWKESRVKKIKKYVDELFIILPFEKEFYKKHNYDVKFVGNPLLDEIVNFKAQSQMDFFSKNSLDQKPIIALLPGSRKQEIKRMFPLMSKMANYYTTYQFVIAATSDFDLKFYKDLIESKNVSFVMDQTYDLLNNSMAALVTSGTATLETALFKVPQVVCYKANCISYQIAKLLVKIDFISLVNLIMKREVVKELIQNDFSRDNLKTEIDNLLDPKSNIKIKSDYKELKAALDTGNASKKAAEIIVSEI
jgi:lipid-A-disaccharide synthase